MTESELLNQFIIEIQNSIDPKFQYLFRNDIYCDLHKEIVMKTMIAMSKRVENTLTDFEKQIYNS